MSKREESEEEEQRQREKGEEGARRQCESERSSGERGGMMKTGRFFPPAQLARHALANADRRVSGIWSK